MEQVDCVRKPWNPVECAMFRMCVTFLTMVAVACGGIPFASCVGACQSAPAAHACEKHGVGDSVAKGCCAGLVAASPVATSERKCCCCGREVSEPRGELSGDSCEQGCDCCHVATPNPVIPMTRNLAEDLVVSLQILLGMVSETLIPAGEKEIAWLCAADGFPPLALCVPIHVLNCVWTV